MITNIRLHNIELNESIEVGTNKLKYVLSLADFGQVEAIQSTTPYINLIGENVDSIRLNPRSIVIKGTALNNEEGLTYKKSVLRKIINPNHTLVITYGNYKIIAKANNSVLFSTDPDRNSDKICDFLVQCTAFNPLFKQLKESVYYEEKVKAVPIFPLAIPKKKGIAFGFIPAISVNNIPNNGDVECGFVIRFTASEGAVTNPKVINNINGKYIEVAIELTQGDIVEVSTVSGEKYAKLFRGQSEIDVFKYVTKKSTMSITLNVGINDLTITAAGNASNMTSSISFAPQWLEVQD